MYNVLNLHNFLHNVLYATIFLLYSQYIYNYFVKICILFGFMNVVALSTWTRCHVVKG